MAQDTLIRRLRALGSGGGAPAPSSSAPAAASGKSSRLIDRLRLLGTSSPLQEAVSGTDALSQVAAPPTIETAPLTPGSPAPGSPESIAAARAAGEQFNPASPSYVPPPPSLVPGEAIPGTGGMRVPLPDAPVDGEAARLRNAIARYAELTQPAPVDMPPPAPPLAPGAAIPGTGGMRVPATQAPPPQPEPVSPFAAESARLRSASGKQAAVPQPPAPLPTDPYRLADSIANARFDAERLPAGADIPWQALQLVHSPVAGVAARVIRGEVSAEAGRDELARHIQQARGTPSAVRSFRAGGGDLLSSIGAVDRMIGLEGPGKALQETGRRIQEANVTPEYKGSGVAMLADPAFYQSVAARSGPTMLALAAVALIGAAAGGAAATLMGLGKLGAAVLTTLGSAGVSRVMEGAMEAGQTYEEALAQGMTDADATRAARSVFDHNLILAGPDAAEFAASFARIPKPAQKAAGAALIAARGKAFTKGVARVLGTAAMEAAEEAAQEVFQREALGKPITWDAAMQQATAAGAVMGAGVAGIGAAARASEEARGATTAPGAAPAAAPEASPGVMETGAPERGAPTAERPLIDRLRGLGSPASGTGQQASPILQGRAQVTQTPETARGRSLQQVGLEAADVVRSNRGQPLSISVAGGQRVEINAGHPWVDEGNLELQDTRGNPVALPFATAIVDAESGALLWSADGGPVAGPVAPQSPTPAKMPEAGGSVGALATLPPLTDNHLKPLDAYAPLLYREGSVADAGRYIPGYVTVDTTVDEPFFASDRDLATGQGANRGILLEFDAGPIRGQVSTSKPTWEVSWSQGSGEFVGRLNDQKTYEKALRRITVLPDARMNKVEKTRLKMVLANLEEQGWTKSNPTGGGVTYTRPGLASIVPEAPALDRAQAVRDVLPGIGENDVIRLVRDLQGTTDQEFAAQMARLRSKPQETAVTAAPPAPAPTPAPATTATVTPSATPEMIERAAVRAINTAKGDAAKALAALTRDIERLQKEHATKYGASVPLTEQRRLANMQGIREAIARRAGVTAPGTETAPIPALDPLQARIKQLESKRFKTGPEEALLKRLKAAPKDWATRWTPGDGVAWYTTASGKEMSRGWAIESIQGHEATLVTVRDVGQTATGGDDPGIGRERTTVALWELVRDRASDSSRLRPTAPAPPREALPASPAAADQPDAELTLYRGQMIPSADEESLGRGRNIARMKDVTDIIFDDDGLTGMLNSQRKLLEKRLAQYAPLKAARDEIDEAEARYRKAYEAQKGTSPIPPDVIAAREAYDRVYAKHNWSYGKTKQMEMLADEIWSRQEAVAKTEKKLADRDRQNEIAQQNSDLLYLTSQRETADAYARQLEKLPDILTGGKPEGYNPTVHEMKARFNNPLDLTAYGQKGSLTMNEARRILEDMGVAQEDIRQILDRETSEDGRLRAYRLFRGENLPVVRKALAVSGHDAVHYTEGDQDNWVVLDRSKVRSAPPAAAKTSESPVSAPAVQPPSVPQPEPAESAQAARDAAHTEYRKVVGPFETDVELALEKGGYYGPRAAPIKLDVMLLARKGLLLNRSNVTDHLPGSQLRSMMTNEFNDLGNLMDNVPDYERRVLKVRDAWNEFQASLASEETPVDRQRRLRERIQDLKAEIADREENLELQRERIRKAEAAKDTTRLELLRESYNDWQGKVQTAQAEIADIEAGLADRPASTDTTAKEGSAPVRATNQQPPAEPLATGKTATAKTERGTAVEIRYAVFNATDLVASHTISLDANPDYPAELQPRDRSRAASESQVARIAATLNPERLGANPMATDGAPIVGPDNVVESGNGRVIALQRVYETAHANAAKYKNWLLANAETFGVDQAAIAQAKTPVLVRVRQTDVDRVKFAGEANEQTTAAMSASEQAAADARQITADMRRMFSPSDEGEIVTAANRSFITAFMGRVIGEAERARYVTAEGSVSQEGVTRIRNAVFALAYGDTSAIAKLAESTDNNVRNVTNAMVVAAGRIAAIKEGAAAGRLHDLAIGHDVAAAMSKLSALRERGETVDSYLRPTQFSLFANDDLTDLQKDILDAVDRAKSKQRLTAILQAYADAAEAAGDPRQSDFFGKSKPTRAEVWTEAVRRIEAEGKASGVQTSLLPDQGARSPGVEQAGGSAAGGERGQGARESSRSAHAAGEAGGVSAQEAMRRKTEETLGRSEPASGQKGGLRLWGPLRGKQAAASRWSFQDPKLEERYQLARGTPRAPVMEPIRQKLRALWNKATRDWEHIPKVPENAELRLQLTRLKKMRDIARDKAARLIQGITVKLNAEQYDLFNRVIILNDLVEEARFQKERAADRGQNTGPEAAAEVLLPFGFVEEPLQREHTRLTAAAQTDSNVWEALEDRRRGLDEITGEYVAAAKAGINWEPELNRKDYYRHQVRQYAVLKKSDVSGTGQEVRAPTGRGFLKPRAGSSLDINTQYIEAEFEVLTQMIHDTAVFKLLELVRTDFNVADSLKARASAMNEQAIMPYFEQLAAAENDRRVMMGERNAEPVTAESLFRQKLHWKQAAALEALGRLAARGELPDGGGRWAGVLEALAETYNLNKAAKAEMGGEYRASEHGVMLPDGAFQELLAYGGWLIREHGGEVGSGKAAQLFKGIREKKQFIREKLGEKFFATWEDLIPEGYIVWQPREGNAVYQAWVIPDRLAEKAQKQELTDLGLEPDDIQRVMALAGKREQLVIPEYVARTLNEFGQVEPARFKLFNDASRAVLRAWKLWVLGNPKRVVKYNVNNLTGDADHVFLGNPSGFKKVPQAALELRDVLFNDRAPTRDLADWMERGGLQSTLQVAELADVSGLTLFRNLIQKEQKRLSLQTLAELPVEVVRKYWRGVRMTSDFRESVLRYANYLDYLEQMRASPDGVPRNFGASNRAEIMALKDVRDRAWKLSNTLLGAYDEVTVLGQYIREHLMPFWSFVETNFRVYTGTFRNAISDGRISAQVGRTFARKTLGVVVRSPFIAMRVGRWVLGAGYISAAAMLWNQLHFPDEEKDLPADVRRKPHIILGRQEDGTVNVVTKLGSLGDFVAWFGGDQIPALTQDYLNGRITAGDVAKAMLLAPVNQLGQSVGGPWKTLVEFVAARSFFPDVFKPGPVRDRWEHLARSLSLEDEYRLVRGRPSKGYWRSWGKALWSEIDPYDQAYRDVLDAKADFLQKKGKGGAFVDYSPKSNALYYFKLAVRYNDLEAAQKYLLEYARYGGTADGLKQSLEALNPLYGLNMEEQAEFIAQLTPELQVKLVAAYGYYQRLLGPEEAPEGTGS